MSKIKIFALGGLNEIGKNMYIVDVDDQIYIFEAGLKYASDELLGIDYIIPNYDYLIENKDRIQGCFITHGHDEQIGALKDLLNDLPDLKIYAGKFTLEIIKQNINNPNISNNLIELKPNKNVKIGNNSIFAIPVSHSLPDSYLYVLNTNDGAIVFTGNFVFDPTMTGPYKTDIGKLAYVGKQGVLCLMSESRYSDLKGFTSPHHRASSILREALNKNPGRILLNIFETQIYRIQELFSEISKTDRNVVIMGKDLEEIIIKAIDMKLVQFDKKRIKNIHNVNEEGIIVIISNEREKPYTSLKRILRGTDKFISLNDQDTVVIASPIYEGNELTSTKIFNQIAKIGSNLVILSKQFLSPHASEEDLLMMLNLMQPKYYFPVIGEYRHQVENANAAKRIGYNDDNILLKLNGMIVEFDDGKLVDKDEVIKTDDVLIDGTSSSDVGDLVLKDRELLNENGIVVVTATIDKKTKQILAEPHIVTKGFIFIKENIDILKESEKICLTVIKDNIRNNYVDYQNIKLSIREKLGKYYYHETECRPMIIVVMQEI